MPSLRSASATRTRRPWPATHSRLAASTMLAITRTMTTTITTIAITRVTPVIAASTTLAIIITMPTIKITTIAITTITPVIAITTITH